jgi:hypothetical protein
MPFATRQSLALCGWDKTEFQHILLHPPASKILKFIIHHRDRASLGYMGLLGLHIPVTAQMPQGGRHVVGTEPDRNLHYRAIQTWLKTNQETLYTNYWTAEEIQRIFYDVYLSAIKTWWG